MTIHYGESRSICGDFGTEDDITTEIHEIRCVGCLVPVLREADDLTPGFFDRELCGYVTGWQTSSHIAGAFVMWTNKSTHCNVLGVFRTTHGETYTFTVRRPGHEDRVTYLPEAESLRFIATRLKYADVQPLSSVAADLLRIEQDYMTEADTDRVVKDIQRSRQLAIKG